MARVNIRATVNGTERVIQCEPDAPLLDVLRADLGLSGPRFGCGVGLCGACFVLVGGRARSSCDFPAWAAEGQDITTVEGLLHDGTMHPVQQAVVDEQAAQCGYCTAGMIMSAVALLRANPAPDQAEIRSALDGNLCRCGSQQRIVRAVLRAAAQASAARPARNGPAGSAPAGSGAAGSGAAGSGAPESGAAGSTRAASTAARQEGAR
jgi:nicotinate dehydrogenase subunit A